MMEKNNSKAEEAEFNELHRLLVQNAVRLLKHGRLVVYKGEVVTLNGEPVYDLPTAAELTAAARILKDNGIDSPQISGKVETAASVALAGIMGSLNELPELENENKARH